MMKVKSIPKDDGRVELFVNGEDIHACPVKDLASTAILFQAELEKLKQDRHEQKKFKARLEKLLEQYDFSKEQELIIFDNGLVFDAKKSRTVGGSVNYTGNGNYKFQLDSKHFKG